MRLEDYPKDPRFVATVLKSEEITGEGADAEVRELVLEVDRDEFDFEIGHGTSAADNASRGIDQAEVGKYAKAGCDIEEEICDRCPSRCMGWDGKELRINDAECVKCMHCINVMPKALKPGKERGATILIGAKAPIIGGALLSAVFVPFLEMEPPYEDIKELVEAIWDFWGEHGKNRERVGEFIQRVGLGTFLDQIGLDPVPEMISHPRTNPYIFFQDEVVEQGAE